MCSKNFGAMVRSRVCNTGCDFCLRKLGSKNWESRQSAWSRRREVAGGPAARRMRPPDLGRYGQARGDWRLSVAIGFGGKSRCQIVAAV